MHYEFLNKRNKVVDYESTEFKNIEIGDLFISKSRLFLKLGIKTKYDNQLVFCLNDNLTYDFSPNTIVIKATYTLTVNNVIDPLIRNRKRYNLFVYNNKKMEEKDGNK